MSDTETTRLSVSRTSLQMGELSKVQQLRSFATPQGRLQLVQKPQGVELFDGDRRMIKKKSVLVTQTSRSHPFQFRVIVSDDGTGTEHFVTVSQHYCQGLTCGRYFAAQLVEASFLFLLDREPKEAMLRRFDLTLISRYFPEFEQQLPQYLARVATSSARIPERDNI